jgi:ABC-2 type transport system permease protein
MTGLPIGAELLKQSRQRALLFWGFLAVPMFATLAAFALELSMAGAHSLAAALEVHPIRSAMRAVALGGNPIAQLFFAIGAAGLFTVEYRYSSWRHIVPRCSRSRLMLAKLAAFAALSAASLALVCAGDFLASLVLPLTRGVAMTDVPPAGLAALLAAWLTSWLELMALAGLVALMAVSTRSTLGAILPPFLLAMAAAFAESYFISAAGVPTPIPLPTFAADSIRAWLWSEGPEAAAFAPGALIGAIVLPVWIAASFGAAMAIFERQDLAEE